MSSVVCVEFFCEWDVCAPLHSSCIAVSKWEKLFFEINHTKKMQCEQGERRGSVWLQRGNSFIRWHAYSSTSLTLLLFPQSPHKFTYLQYLSRRMWLNFFSQLLVSSRYISRCVCDLYVCETVLTINTWCCRSLNCPASNISMSNTSGQSHSTQVHCVLYLDTSMLHTHPCTCSL